MQLRMSLATVRPFYLHTEDFVSELTSERSATAKLRYFVYRGLIGDKYRFSVCDAEANPKTIARFKSEEHAERFRRLIASDYIRGRTA